jgi:hypothetical protein
MTSTVCPTRNLFLFADAELRKDPTKDFVRRNSARNFTECVGCGAYIDRDKLPSRPTLYGLKGLPQGRASPAQRITVSHVRDRDTIRCLKAL